MLNNQKKILALVGDIYESGIDPAYWSTTLANLCLLLDAKSAGIFIKEYKTNTVKMAYVHGFPKPIQAYLQPRTC